MIVYKILYFTETFLCCVEFEHECPSRKLLQLFGLAAQNTLNSSNLPCFIFSGFMTDVNDWCYYFYIYFI